MLRRFFARFMDLCFFSFLSFEICVDLIPRIFRFLEIRDFLFDIDPYSICHYLYPLFLINYSFRYMVVLFIVAIFLALVSSIRGTTPGKAALGVKVLPEADLRGFWQRFGFYLWREMRVWVFGLGCGFLLITPIFMIWQALRLQKGKAAFYDGIAKVRVTFVKAKILVLVVWLPVALLMLTFLVAIFVFNVKLYQTFQKYKCPHYEKTLR